MPAFFHSFKIHNSRKWWLQTELLHSWNSVMCVKYGTGGDVSANMFIYEIYVSVMNHISQHPSSLSSVRSVRFLCVRVTVHLCAQTICHTFKSRIHIFMARASARTPPQLHDVCTLTLERALCAQRFSNIMLRARAQRIFLYRRLLHEARALLCLCVCVFVSLPAKKMRLLRAHAPRCRRTRKCIQSRAFDIEMYMARMRRRRNAHVSSVCAFLACTATKTCAHKHGCRTFCA